VNNDHVLSSSHFAFGVQDNLIQDLHADHSTSTVLAADQREAGHPLIGKYVLHISAVLILMSQWFWAR